MAEKRQFFDVWILETNTVYREVPYTVVTDWAQQGRLLPDDNLRPSGTAQWMKLSEMPAFAVYLPQAEPFQAEDTAEALEPVHGDIVVHPHPGDEDEDVDMIPLIDISLVLLIFFMMTAAVGGAASIFDTPRANYKLISAKPEIVWVGIRRDDAGEPNYSFGKGEGDKGKEFARDRAAMLQALATELNELAKENPVEINIQADQSLPFDVVSEMTVELVKFKRQGKIAKIYGGVREKEGS